MKYCQVHSLWYYDWCPQCFPPLTASNTVESPIKEEESQDELWYVIEDIIFDMKRAFDNHGDYKKMNKLREELKSKFHITRKQ